MISLSKISKLNYGFTMMNRISNFISQTRAISIVRRDGNDNYLVQLNNGSLNDILNICKNADQNKAILIRGTCDGIINAYNRKINNHDQNARYQCNDDKGNSVYLIPNNSKCEELYKGSLYGAGANIIVKYNSDFYSLFVKKRTNKYISCPGGTYRYGDQFEYSHINDGNRIVNDELLVYNIIERELLHQSIDSNDTQHYFRLNNYMLRNRPHKYELDKIARLYYQTNFFDIENIKKVQTIFSIYVDYDSDKIHYKLYDFKGNYNHPYSTDFMSYYDIVDFFRNLFNPSNIVDDNCYMLDYSKNTEIEYVYAYQLWNPLLMSSPENFTKHPIYWENRHPITTLHLSMSYMNLYKIYSRLYWKNLPEFRHTKYQVFDKIDCQTKGYSDNLVKMELFM